MKLKILSLAIATLALAFSSCDPSGNYNSTPDIVPLYHLKSNNDTLGIYTTDQGGVWIMDTISAGDTVYFNFAFNAHFNTIKSLYIRPTDTISTKNLFLEKTKLDSFCIVTQSNYSKGQFVINGSNSLVIFPFRYVALKANKNASLLLSVTTDGAYSNGNIDNTKTVTLKTPIK